MNQSLRIFLWSFAFIYVVTCSLQIIQVDLWWQLQEGAQILKTWTLPTAPVAAFGLPATDYFDEYAGYEVVLVLLYKIGGFPALWMAFISVYLMIVFLPIATSGKKYPAFDLPSTLALVFAGILMQGRSQQRPELIGALLLVILMATLRGMKLEVVAPRALAKLFLIFLAWTNTHSTFVIGFFVIGLWGATEMGLKFEKIPITILMRSAATIAGVTLVASMLNPYGARRLLFPFAQANDPGSTALSPEMWPLADPYSTGGILLMITGALLAWGLVTTKRVPLWLILFSFFSLFMAVKSFRFVNLVSISVFFVYSLRTTPPPSEKDPPVFAVPFLVLKSLTLSALCLFLLFGDAFGFLFVLGEMRAEDRLAAHRVRFAPHISGLAVAPSGTRIPALCGHNMGSYLSMAGNGQFQPLLDSGLSHFDDDTKRYFFFLWHAPDALGLVLRDLHVNYVIIGKETFPWVPTIHRLKDWEFVTCDSSGILLRRSSGEPHALTATDRDLIEQAMDKLHKKDELVDAFDYSTLLDNPNDSLALLEECNSRDWSETFFNSVCAWVDSLPPDVIAKFLASDHSRQYPLVDAVLTLRLGPDAFTKFVTTNPGGPRPWFWKALAARAALEKGDTPAARAIFNTIYPVPVSSVSYYQLWHAVRKDSPASNDEPSAYGQWQTWDENGKRFIDSMSERLNNRITVLDGS